MTSGVNPSACHTQPLTSRARLLRGFSMGTSLSYRGDCVWNRLSGDVAASPFNRCHENNRLLTASGPESASLRISSIRFLRCPMAYVALILPLLASSCERSILLCEREYSCGLGNILVDSKRTFLGRPQGIHGRPF